MRAIHLDAETKKFDTVVIEQWKSAYGVYFMSYWNKTVHADKDTIAIWKIKYKNKKTWQPLQ